MRQMGTITRIMSRMASTHVYSEKAFDNFSNYLLGNPTEATMLKILPAFLSLCARQRYLNIPLLKLSGIYVAQNIKHYEPFQLQHVIHSLAQLNHSNQATANAIEDYLLKENRYQEYSLLAFMLAWYGMVHQQYPASLLEIILTDDYIAGKELM